MLFNGLFNKTSDTWIYFVQPLSAIFCVSYTWNMN